LTYINKRLCRWKWKLWACSRDICRFGWKL